MLLSSRTMPRSKIELYQFNVKEAEHTDKTHITEEKGSMSTRRTEQISAPSS